MMKRRNIAGWSLWIAGLTAATVCGQTPVSSPPRPPAPASGSPVVEHGFAVDARPQTVPVGSPVAVTSAPPVGKVPTASAPVVSTPVRTPIIVGSPVPVKSAPPKLGSGSVASSGTIVLELPTDAPAVVTPPTMPPSAAPLPSDRRSILGPVGPSVTSIPHGEPTVILSEPAGPQFNPYFGYYPTQWRSYPSMFVNPGAVRTPIPGAPVPGAIEGIAPTAPQLLRRGSLIPDPSPVPQGPVGSSLMSPTPVGSSLPFDLDVMKGKEPPKPATATDLPAKGRATGPIEKPVSPLIPPIIPDLPAAPASIEIPATLPDLPAVIPAVGSSGPIFVPAPPQQGNSGPVIQASASVPAVPTARLGRPQVAPPPGDAVVRPGPAVINPADPVTKPGWPIIINGKKN